MTTWATGSLTMSATNLATGKTITGNISGPSKDTVFPDGSVTAREKGRNGLALTPADAARFGLPALSVTAGDRSVTIAPGGSITARSLHGHVLVDACAALS